MGRQGQGHRVELVCGLRIRRRAGRGAVRSRKSERPSAGDLPDRAGRRTCAQDRHLRTRDHVDYAEDIYVGYRYFDTRQVPVLFPFGHGLSYTDFAFRDLDVRQVDDEIRVTFTVENIGDCAGKAVAQVYLGLEAPARTARPRNSRDSPRSSWTQGSSAKSPWRCLPPRRCVTGPTNPEPTPWHRRQACSWEIRGRYPSLRTCRITLIYKLINKVK